MPYNIYNIRIKNEKSAYCDKKLSEISHRTSVGDLVPERSVLAVDASNMLYSSILALKNVRTLTNDSGSNTGYWKIILQKIALFARHRIQLVFVFDSPVPNKYKLVELERRARAREERVERAETDEAKEKAGFRITSEEISRLKILLTLTGTDYYEVKPGTNIEGEQFAAHLTRGSIPSTRRCQYVLTNDGDALLFGGNIIRYTRGKKKDGTIRTATEYNPFDLYQVLRELDISYEEFVTIGVILGTDFNPATPGVGPDGVMKKFSKVRLTPEQEEIKAYFMQDISDNAAIFTPGKFNPDVLTGYLTDNGFSGKTIRDAISDLSRIYNA